MSFSFSEETTFIIQNWGTIEKLLNSVQVFKNEFIKFFWSLEDLIRAKEWWSDEELEFNKVGQPQVYLSRKEWLNSIWIGVERFTPENVLGASDPAHCYLWVTGSKASFLAQDINNI